MIGEFTPNGAKGTVQGNIRGTSEPFFTNVH